MSRETSDTDARTDEELVAAMNRGEREAFDALYQRHRDWVVSLAFRFTSQRDEAMDIMQDAFIYLLRKFPGFELRAKLTTFLYPVVRHLAIDRRRKAKREVAGGDGLLDAAGDGGGDWRRGERRGDDPAEREHLDDLARVLGTLSEGHREVVLLRFVDGFSMEEIAEALAIPAGTVKSRLHNALKTLRDDPATREYFDQP